MLHREFKKFIKKVLLHYLEAERRAENIKDYEITKICLKNDAFDTNFRITYTAKNEDIYFIEIYIADFSRNSKIKVDTKDEYLDLINKEYSLDAKLYIALQHHIREFFYLYNFSYAIDIESKKEEYNTFYKTVFYVNNNILYSLSVYF